MRTQGKQHCPQITELLILADSGGADSARSQLFKGDLKQKPCNRRGLRDTLCHYPPGTSKWNPIEHRLVSEISKHWEDLPLRSYEVALKHITTTHTATGLTASAKLNSKEHQTGEKVTAQELQCLNIRRHRYLPDWNDTISTHNRNCSRKLSSRLYTVSMRTCSPLSRFPERVPLHIARFWLFE